MATSAPAQDLRPRLATQRASIPALLPGIALLAIVGYSGKFVEHFLNTRSEERRVGKEC